MDSNLDNLNVTFMYSNLTKHNRQTKLQSNTSKAKGILEYQKMTYSHAMEHNPNDYLQNSS